MKTRHTSEEWRVSEQYALVTTSKPGIIEGDKTICELGTHGKDKDEIMANAKLIAAAPKMLELLETIENDTNIVPDWLWNRIKDVIKQATE